jgi:hypothetical protein
VHLDVVRRLGPIVHVLEEECQPNSEEPAAED